VLYIQNIFCYILALFLAIQRCWIGTKAFLKKML
jgi:hypothetical protein